MLVIFGFLRLPAMTYFKTTILNYATKGRRNQMTQLQSLEKKFYFQKSKKENGNEHT